MKYCGFEIIGLVRVFICGHDSAICAHPSSSLKRYWSAASAFLSHSC